MSFFGHISTHNIESVHCGQTKLIKHCLIPPLLCSCRLRFSDGCVCGSPMSAVSTFSWNVFSSMNTLPLGGAVGKAGAERATHPHPGAESAS